MSATVGLAALVLVLGLVVELGWALARARRRIRMNRAMHELRRPIQSLSLAIDGDGRDLTTAASWMDQVRHALEDLDAEINGRTRAPARTSVALAEIAYAAECRWRREGVRVEAPVAGAVLRGDRWRIGSALDNLIANALGHGGGSVKVRALTAPGVARLEVRDGGVAEPAHAADAGGGDPRRGHGLTVAAGVAASHGGVLIPPHATRDGDTVAALTLPIIEPEHDLSTDLD